MHHCLEAIMSCGPVDGTKVEVILCLFISCTCTEDLSEGYLLSIIAGELRVAQ